MKTKNLIPTVPDAAHFFVVKETIFVEVYESLGLLLVGRRKTISVRLIVFKFRVDKVVDLERGG
jgi:hypothetical protein